ncbi:MAG TPA: hypothetical protein VKB60_06775, partial [Terriglobales bacterium]|nr:hypothetical protein [Terriglobales bacterium]
MSKHKSSVPSPLVRLSRQTRKRASRKQEKARRLITASRLHRRNKSSQLCRHSDELLRRSHDLC